MQPTTGKHKGWILRHLIKIFFLAITLCWLLPTPGGAETFQPKLGRYFYDVSWGGIPTGSAEVSVNREGDFFVVQASARALGVVDRLYKLSYQGESQIDAEDLAPIRTELVSREGRRSRQTEINYNDDGTVEAVRTKLKSGKIHSKDREEFHFDSMVFDPFAAVFVARSLDWHIGMAQEFEVFTGSTHYLLELNAVAQRQIDLPEGTRLAWEIVPTIENLSRPEEPNKVESVFIYLSADPKKELLMLESKHSVGNIRVKLSKFVPDI